MESTPLPCRIVLLRPRNADNLGSIARAMKNFGLSDWVVVSPNPKLLEVPGMNRLAVKAGELLETVRRVDTFAEAVADCSWVVGTTSRVIEGRRRAAPAEIAREAVTRGERFALVFGDERSGLTNEDLVQCHALSVIPAEEEQPSLNLSQAVLVYTYELYQARHAGAAPAPTAALADDSALRNIRGAAEEALTAAGFLRDGRGGFDALLGSLLRAHPTKKEAGLWMAAFKAIAKALVRGGGFNGGGGAG
ncbi:MAG: RNA methyltransferase [Myxococcaceae bacterium]